MSFMLVFKQSYVSVSSQVIFCIDSVVSEEQMGDCHLLQLVEVFVFYFVDSNISRKNFYRDPKYIDQNGILT